MHLRRDSLPTLVFLGFPGGSPGKESTCDANLYSLKAKKVPAGRLALGDWLGDCWVATGMGTFVNLESGSLLLMIGGSFSNFYRSSQSLPDITLVLGSTSVTLMEDLAPVALGQNSTKNIN